MQFELLISHTVQLRLLITTSVMFSIGVKKPDNENKVQRLYESASEC